MSKRIKTVKDLKKTLDHFSDIQEVKAMSTDLQIMEIVDVVVRGGKVCLEVMR
jgi:hypothetical protein